MTFIFLLRLVLTQKVTLASWMISREGLLQSMSGIYSQWLMMAENSIIQLTYQWLSFTWMESDSLEMSRTMMVGILSILHLSLGIWRNVLRNFEDVIFSYHLKRSWLAGKNYNRLWASLCHIHQNMSHHMIYHVHNTALLLKDKCCYSHDSLPLVGNQKCFAQLCTC